MWPRAGWKEETELKALYFMKLKPAISWGQLLMEDKGVERPACSQGLKGGNLSWVLRFVFRAEVINRKNTSGILVLEGLQFSLQQISKSL